MPEIAIYMNCDTRLAINLSLFELGDKDEFIFTIKNYNYLDSPAAFIFRTKKEYIDEETGEVIFRITPEESKKIKPGAFYNFSVLVNAFNPDEPTEYKKLTENGSIHLEYGAQDLGLASEEPEDLTGYEIASIRLEQID